MAAVSALLQLTALGHAPITDPQLHSVSTRSPGCGVQEQCRAPSQVIPPGGTLGMLIPSPWPCATMPGA